MGNPAAELRSDEVRPASFSATDRLGILPGWRHRNVDLKIINGALAPTGKWSGDLLDHFRKNNLRGLNLNCAWGWHGDNLDFLSQPELIERLEDLSILDDEIVDIRGIAGLKNLRTLHVTAAFGG